MKSLAILRFAFWTRRSMWVFETKEVIPAERPEYESVEFSSNRGMAHDVRQFFGRKTPASMSSLLAASLVSRLRSTSRNVYLADLIHAVVSMIAEVATRRRPRASMLLYFRQIFCDSTFEQALGRRGFRYRNRRDTRQNSETSSSAWRE